MNKLMKYGIPFSCCIGDLLLLISILVTISALKKELSYSLIIFIVFIYLVYRIWKRQGGLCAWSKKVRHQFYKNWDKFHNEDFVWTINKKSKIKDLYSK